MIKNLSTLESILRPGVIWFECLISIRYPSSQIPGPRQPEIRKSALTIPWPYSWTFFFLTWKAVRDRDFHLLVHSPKTCNTRPASGQRQEARNSIQVSCAGELHLTIWAIICYYPDVHYGHTFTLILHFKSLEPANNQRVHGYYLFSCNTFPLMSFNFVYLWYCEISKNQPPKCPQTPLVIQDFPQLIMTLESPSLYLRTPQAWHLIPKWKANSPTPVPRLTSFWQWEMSDKCILCPLWEHRLGLGS